MWFPGNHLHDFSYYLPQKKSMYNKTPTTCVFFLASGVSRQPRHWKRTFLNSEFHSSSAPAHSAKLVSSSMLKPQHRHAHWGQLHRPCGPCSRPRVDAPPKKYNKLIMRPSSFESGCVKVGQRSLI